MPKRTKTVKKGQWGGKRPNQTGRPPIEQGYKSVAVSLMIPGSIYQRIQVKAESEDVSVNDVIREVLKKNFDKP